MKSTEFKPEDSVGLLAANNKIQSQSTKAISFDLQHVSPIIQGKLPKQLHMIFDERRKQKNLTIQSEPDYDRVEPYKVLQYKLKQELREREQKEKDRIEKVLAQKRARIMR